jgi:hypothetical protein
VSVQRVASTIAGAVVLGGLAIGARAPNTGATNTMHSVAFAVAARIERSLFDPLATARASIGKTVNLEASVPPQCYTKTGATSNPCWTCHTPSRGLNAANDWELQREYAFSDFALENRWSNLFLDRREPIEKISDGEILAWIRTDNHSALAESLRGRSDYRGWVPDLDLEAGFDDRGFAKDGSGWRAIRYKPFPGTFWPTNGSTDDVFVRLPKEFRSDRDVERANLSILEAALVADADTTADPARREIEPIDERRVGVDLDSDGTLGIIQFLGKLPKNYVGAASVVRVRRGVYPRGTEFLHTVRYVDPDAPTLLSRRLKELRYMKKVDDLDVWATTRAWDRERNEKEEGYLPVYPGSPDVGYKNAFGWQLQGFIEDEVGRLRLQTEEEHRFCMGCHSGIGATIDSTFAMPRKVPGADGWKHQDLRGIPDVPMRGHTQGEILIYFQRVGGGDETRSNDELLARFFSRGGVDEKLVARASDVAALVTPSRDRALLLDKAYRVIVGAQSFVRGRDPVVTPAVNVHEKLANGQTEVAASEHVYSDGDLRLAWPQP